MENTALLNKMFNAYNAIAYTAHYIVGFIFKDNVYFAKMNDNEIARYIVLDKASRGAGYAIRFNPKAEQKIAMLTSATLLCSKAFFKEQVDTTPYNKGEIFEKMVTERCGQVWTKDHVPFTEAGDIVVNGTPYQIKFQRATFCNEKTLASLAK
jgi:hypothetical protein